MEQYGEDYTNTVYAQYDDTKSSSVTVGGFTGDITLTKYNEDGKKTLSGAEFEVAGEDGKTLTFVKNANGEYVLSTANGASATLTTDGTGKFVVKGLKEGEYAFKETKAPTGYAINPEVKTVTIVDKDTNTGSYAHDSKTVAYNDSILISLPFTGGIGTTLFTLTGVAIMSIAAALYFATKRAKED